MKQLIIKHKVFYYLFSLFVLVVGILLFQIDKGDVIIFCSDNRTPFWNHFFKITTQFGEEPAYAIIAVGFFFIRFRISLLFGLMGGIITLCSFGLKSLFSAERPFTFFDKLGKFNEIITVEGIDLLVGPTSFPSGHTMSGFGLYLLLMFFLPAKKRFSIICFGLAFVVGFSRIYLVQHFLQDILAGAFCGVLIGTLVYYFNDKIPYNSKYWIDRSLLNLKNVDKRQVV